MKLLTKFFIFCILFISTSSKATDIPNKNIVEPKSWKLEKITKPTPFPSDIPFYDKDNQKHFIEDFEGRTLLIVFWATWCAPCLHEMIELDLLKKDFRKLPIDILPISQDFGGIKVIEPFYQQNGIRNLPIYHDYKNELFRELKASGVPACYIIDKDGFIKAIIKGSVNWGEETMRQLLLEYIEGNPVMPKNSYRNNSLNQTIKASPIKTEAPKTEEKK